VSESECAVSVYRISSLEQFFWMGYDCKDHKDNAYAKGPGPQWL
jgi:hypothetical protein